MQKWRTSYNLMDRKKIKNDETGITLVELLAAISILSIVILLAGSVHMFGQRQFIDQTKSASQENDISYAMTVITTDLRKIIPADEEIIVTRDELEVKDRYVYKLAGDKLKKGETVLAEGVTAIFKRIPEDGDIQGIHLTIGSSTSKEFETTIYFRR